MLSIDTTLNEFVDVFERDGVSLEYLFLPQPEADTLVFLHGMGAEMRYFWPHIPFFAGGYQILTVSLRGHGKSSTPQPVDNTMYSVGYHTLDLLVLLEFLEIYEFILVGHGLGGIIGFELMHRLPERLIGCVALGSNAHVRYPKWVRQVSGGMFSLSGGMGGKHFARDYLKNMSREKDTQQFVSRLIKPDFRVTAAVQSALADYSYADTLRHTDVPLLYVLGQEDPQMSQLGHTTHAIQENENPTVQYGLLDGAGHLVNLDKFGDCNVVLMNYLNML
jgi:pimeloyl-ACP methyl ester carboxylesterase